MGEMNGTGRGENGDRENLIRFPTMAERDALRRRRLSEEGPFRPKPPPFFNLSRIPPFTRAMLLLFLIVHILLRALLDPESLSHVVYTFGFVPGDFTGASGEFPYLAVFSPVTYLFIHGGWGHLAFNSLMMFAMGTLMERGIGSRKTAIIFFVSGLAGAAFHLIFNPYSAEPVIGASAAVTGLFGAATMLLYRRSGVGHFGGRWERMGAWPLIGFWIVLMAGMGMVGGGEQAWQAHIGGFLAGILLLQFMLRA